MSGNTADPTAAIPARGSAAATQTRDAYGRFRTVGGTPDRKRRAGAGRTGPSYLTRKSKLELARMLTRITLEYEARLSEASGGRAEWREPAVPLNMQSIRSAQQAETRRRRSALAEILDDFAADRRDPRPSELAREMSARLGGPFSTPQLYRSNLVDLWRSEADYFGRCGEDLVPGALEHTRLSRRVIVHHILRIKRLLAELDAERTACLALTAEGEGWTPLVLRS